MIGMKRIAILWVLAALLAIAGCGKEGALGAKGSDPEAPKLVGKWKGELKMPKSEKEDPMAEMGAAFAKMLLGSLTLEFTSEDRFKLSMMGVPVEGKVERKGNALTLTPESAMGMPVAEAKKQNPQLKSDPMEAEISADGSEISLKDKDHKEGEPTMVFTRAKDIVKKVEKATVTEEEKPLVGSYGAELYGTRPEKLSEKEQGELKMAESMLESASLQLFEDNTFHLNFVFEMEGTWKVENGIARLHMVKMLGMPDDGKGTSKSDDMNLRVEADGRLVNDQDGPGGAKMAFVKK